MEFLAINPCWTMVFIYSFFSKFLLILFDCCWNFSSCLVQVNWKVFKRFPVFGSFVIHIGQWQLFDLDRTFNWLLSDAFCCGHQWRNLHNNAVPFFCVGGFQNSMDCIWTEISFYIQKPNYPSQSLSQINSNFSRQYLKKTN